MLAYRKTTCSPIVCCGNAYVAFGFVVIQRMGRVQNNDIRDRLGVAPIEEMLVQHRLRWFGHIQRRPLEAPAHSGILSHDNNVRRGRGKLKSWEEEIKRDLKKWDIPKDFCLNRSVESLFMCLNLD